MANVLSSLDGAGAYTTLLIRFHEYNLHNSQVLEYAGRIRGGARLGGARQPAPCAVDMRAAFKDAPWQAQCSDVRVLVSAPEDAANEKRVRFFHYDGESGTQKLLDAAENADDIVRSVEGLDAAPHGPWQRIGFVLVVLAAVCSGCILFACCVAKRKDAQRQYAANAPRSATLGTPLTRIRAAQTSHAVAPIIREKQRKRRERTQRQQDVEE